MSDLISRDAAYDEIIWNSDNGLIDAKVAIEALRKLPSVEPERKTGKWVHMVGWWECDQCNAEYTDMPTCMGKVIYEYCPMCGAKMEVDK